MKKFKLNRKSVVFEYEFENGETVELKYMEPTTEQIDGSFKDNVEEKLSYTKEVLRECLSGDEKDIKRVIKEQIKYGNIYEFKSQLDEELGKLKKKG